MGFNFPNSPIPGQIYSPVGGYSYVWLDGVWRMVQPQGAVMEYIASPSADMRAGFKTGPNLFVVNDKADGTGTDVATMSETGAMSAATMTAAGKVTAGDAELGTTIAGGNVWSNIHCAGNGSLNGYQKFRSTIIIQWGFWPGGGDTTITYPMAFPSACLSCVATINSSTLAAGSVVSAAVESVTKNTFILRTRYINNGGGAGVASQPCCWFAVGV